MLSLLQLHLVPNGRNLLRRFGSGVAEDVGMAANHLFVHRGADVLDGKFPGIGSDLALQHYLQQHVAELLLQMLGVARLDGCRGLVGFLDHVLADGGMGLLAIPGTTLGTAQDGDGLYEGIE